MKIATENQQPSVAAQVLEKIPAAREAEAARPQEAKAPPRRDSVELSAALDAELRAQEAEQARRVATIKTRLAAGEYHVSPRAVAEKILSDRLDK